MIDDLETEDAPRQTEEGSSLTHKTVRLTVDQISALEKIAATHGVPVSVALRDAIDTGLKITASKKPFDFDRLAFTVEVTYALAMTIAESEHAPLLANALADAKANLVKYHA